MASQSVRSLQRLGIVLRQINAHAAGTGGARNYREYSRAVFREHRIWIQGSSSSPLQRQVVILGSVVGNGFPLLGLPLSALLLLASTSLSMTGPEELEPDTLAALARDLGSDSVQDKERSITMLSGLTMYLEHHTALLAAGVLEALVDVMCHDRMVPQVRIVALGCFADLMKAQETHPAVAEHGRVLQTIVEAAQSKGSWARGPEQGGIARTHAARALAELCGDTSMHQPLIDQGAVEALGTRAGLVADESMKQDKTYSSLSAVPGSVIDVQEVEEERYLSAALYGLCWTQNAATALLRHQGKPAQAMAKWAASSDPILQRYGVGGLARLAVLNPASYDAVKSAGGLGGLIHGLTCSDPAAQCSAAGAVGTLLQKGGPATADLLLQGTVEALVKMLEPPQSTVPGAGSEAVRRGVYRCALRALVKGTENDVVRGALLSSQATSAVEKVKAGGNNKGDAQLVELADNVLGNLS